MNADTVKLLRRIQREIKKEPRRFSAQEIGSAKAAEVAIARIEHFIKTKGEE